MSKNFVNQTNNSGFTPINACAFNSELDKNIKNSIINMLLKAGAAPDIVNNKGYSARDNYKDYSWSTASQLNNNKARRYSLFHQNKTCHPPTTSTTTISFTNTHDSPQVK
ncbi:MAG: hypothetical protein KIT27_06100 [Legionellales bacterium]|nr:hypothetical protein [Legionellales bacterium]